LSDVPIGEGNNLKSDKRDEEKKENWKDMRDEEDSDDEWKLSSKFIRPGKYLLTLLRDDLCLLQLFLKKK
jgi:hypothetical protein